MSTLTTHTTATRATPSGSNIGLCKFNTTSKAIEVSDGSNWAVYDYDNISYPNAYSVDFDGTDDHVAISSFNFASNKTLSYWVKFDAINSAGVYIFGTGSNYYTYVTSDGQTIYLYDGSVTALTLGATHAITAGVWTHIAIVGSGGTATLYKDGVSRATGTDRTPTGVNRFAGDSVGGTRFVNGLMDEVAYWDSALSASQIVEIYNNGSPINLSSYNPVNWWRMGDNDSGTGTTITDQGSAGNDGTLTNGPTFSTTVPS
jgi:hypothetical protein